MKLTEQQVLDLEQITLSYYDVVETKLVTREVGMSPFFAAAINSKVLKVLIGDYNKVEAFRLNSDHDSISINIYHQ